MVICSILLLGPPEVHKDTQLTQIRLRKAMALMAYLAVENRPFSREYLATLLWPDRGQTSGLANLRRVLTTLRGVFSNGCIVANGDQIHLDPTFFHTDIDEFRVLTSLDSEEVDLQGLETAFRLYRGRFLEGFNLGNCDEFDEWQSIVRRRFESEYDKLLQKLVNAYLGAGRVQDALTFARRWLELDQMNEAAHRALMQINAQTGRIDLARRQFEACVRILANEHMEPEDKTLELHTSITANRLQQSPATQSESPRLPSSAATPNGRVHQIGWRGRRVRVAAVGLAVLAVSAFIRPWRYIGVHDFVIEDVHVVQDDGRFDGIDVLIRHIGGAGTRDANLSIVFSASPAIGSDQEFLVYSDTLRVGKNSMESVHASAEEHIKSFIDTNDVWIPPGYYTVSTMVHTKATRREVSVLNNHRASDERFFFGGAEGIVFIEVEIDYSGSDPLNDENPLLVYVESGSVDLKLRRWGPFRVIAAGRYFLPLKGVTTEDAQVSRCSLVFIHDKDDDMQDRYSFDHGDIGALYNGNHSSGNLVYGGFHSSAGAPVFSGDYVRVDFSPPPRPEPDAFESDNDPALSPPIDLENLPIRDFHTFHDDEAGTMDADWSRVYLEAGESITVETFSAGGLWEADIQIDVADSDINYIRSAYHKPMERGYAKMTFTNETGVDQVFYFCIKPYNQYSGGPYGSGEYIVEWR